MCDGTAAHLNPVVLGDGEARGVLGLGLLADRGEHAPHEAALVAAEVEPGGPGGGGGSQEHGEGEEHGAGAAAAAKHRGGARCRLLQSFGLVGVSASGCCLLASGCFLGWGGESECGRFVGVEGTATAPPIPAVHDLDRAVDSMRTLVVSVGSTPQDFFLLRGSIYFVQ